MLATIQTTQRPRPVMWDDAVIGKAAAPEVLDTLKSQGVSMRADRDEEIIAQGERAGFCYYVVSGCVRTVKLMKDGRRLVGAFLFPGDLFGWEALDEHDFGAEAVTPVTLRRYTRHTLEALADRDCGFAHRLRELTAGQLRAGRERFVLLGRKTALERIASFLLEMTERMRLGGRATFELPMGRTDMADYLGLTIETVSRGLTQLRQHGTIAVERASVMICDRRALGVAGCEVLH
jgi:CRP/FNR family transcriptional regulator, nitrogen fixation regulation protein